ncbi:hypothetical protein GIY23_02710 [Allosaccharopolyspora coralli]|uniref:Uncharacterized protein n=1 Tax=Allosaccharopolyspora coralli TaxID=2665642 RepID=A0A5Q3Q2N5_9PSEU|nr:hypothetical protein [Allosaccharopolyspora coralli]QGK68613.1 hypothetical protein GIY23_02710 [Allosaccharopolyspora coralli]
MSALHELLQALHGVEEHMTRARGELATSRSALVEAQAALASLDPHHPETVVPPGLFRADDQITRAIDLLDRSGALLGDFAGRL